MLCTFEIPYLYFPNKEPERPTILHTYAIQSGGLNNNIKNNNQILENAFLRCFQLWCFWRLLCDQDVARTDLSLFWRENIQINAWKVIRMIVYQMCKLNTTVKCTFFIIKILFPVWEVLYRNAHLYKCYPTLEL
jgi:hypothetical protein